MIEDLTLDLKRDEGFRQHPYKDSVGIWTVGYGRNLEDVGIREKEAEVLLQNDIMHVLSEMEREWIWLEDVPNDVHRGLANMAFNLGMPRLKGFKKMLDALCVLDFNKAADEALDSKWAKQVGRRADRIAELFRNSV
jgi:lysozyme